MVNIKYTNSKKLNDVLNEYVRLGGDPERFLYVSRPGGGQVRVVFQGKVCTGYPDAIKYVQGLIEELKEEGRSE